MYSITIYDGVHTNGTKFYRTVAVAGPDSSVHIFQWGALASGNVPQTTEAPANRREVMLHRHRSDAEHSAAKKRADKGKWHGSGPGAGRYYFQRIHNETVADLSELIALDAFQVLCEG